MASNFMHSIRTFVLLWLGRFSTNLFLDYITHQIGFLIYYRKGTAVRLHLILLMPFRLHFTQNSAFQITSQRSALNGEVLKQWRIQDPRMGGHVGVFLPKVVTSPGDGRRLKRCEVWCGQMTSSLRVTTTIRIR